MATGTEAYDAAAGGESHVLHNVPMTVLKKTMNAATIIAADGGTGLASSSKITAGEEITAFELPVGFKIFGVATYVRTAGTTGGTINIGTLADTTAFDAAVDIVTTGWTGDSETDAQAIASGGALITTVTSDANKIVVEYIADETTGEFDVIVYGLDIGAVNRT